MRGQEWLICRYNKMAGRLVSTSDAVPSNIRMCTCMCVLYTKTPAGTIVKICSLPTPNLLTESLLTFQLHAAAFFRVQLNKPN